MLRQLASKRLITQRIQILPRFYHEKVIDHFNNPRNVGSFDKNDPAMLVSKPFGCGSAIASSSVATEWVKGKQMEEVMTIKNT
ncbi:hypothetical protein OIU78_016858 [Salix suchowensis]|nr:hypothetical protein OIU78_016858 [Salix suchowensis]